MDTLFAIVQVRDQSSQIYNPTVVSRIDFRSDLYEDRIIKHFRQMMNAMLSEKSKDENMNDDVDEEQKYIGGHRAATVWHRAAEEFVERQRMLFRATSWNCDRNIKANHLGFCLSQRNIKNTPNVPKNSIPNVPKNSILTAVMKKTKWFSTWSRFLRR